MSARKETLEFDEKSGTGLASKLSFVVKDNDFDDKSSDFGSDEGSEELPTAAELLASGPPAILGKLRDFLPSLKQENEKLSRVPASSLDIENIEDESKPHIAMDIGFMFDVIQTDAQHPSVEQCIAEVTGIESKTRSLVEEVPPQ
jgi:hypothetical protein